MISFLTEFKSFQTSGAEAFKPGLERMFEMDAMTGHPHRRYRTIHVAGTNGKGSVSNMLASCLAAAGLRVGLYTSPHILDVRERARIREAGGVKFISEDYMKHWAELYGDAARTLPLSFFEVTTAMAFCWFADEKVDVAVIETGLGGRLDSTNIITPQLSVITNIGYDHCDILGRTLEKIAFEKAGIIKPGVPVVVGESSPETDPVFIRRAAQEGSEIHFADRENPPFWDERDALLAEMDLQGNYQRANLRTVLCALSVLGVRPDRNALIHTASIMDFHGRWERLCSDPEVICDIGHNAHGLKWNFARLNEMVKEGRRLIMVYGSVADKDVDAVLELMPEASFICFTNAEGSRALPAEECMNRYLAIRRGGAESGVVRLQDGAEVSVAAYPKVSAAVAAALDKAAEICAEDAQARPLIYIGGSTYVVAEATAFLRS